MNIEIVSNVERLEEMAILQFNRSLDNCTIKEIKQCLECMEAEDDYIHNEDISYYETTAQYYGLLPF